MGRGAGAAPSGVGLLSPVLAPGAHAGRRSQLTQWQLETKDVWLQGPSGPLLQWGKKSCKALWHAVITKEHIRACRGHSAVGPR